MGPFGLIGGLAVNCYVEPVYTLDADFVVVASKVTELERQLRAGGFSVQTFPYLLNAQAQSDLRAQFTTDPRYQAFPDRAQEREVLGVRLPVACLEDIVLSRLWSYSDRERRLSKSKKDELDLLRLAEALSHLRELYPPDLRRLLE